MSHHVDMVDLHEDCGDSRQASGAGGGEHVIEPIVAAVAHSMRTQAMRRGGARRSGMCSDPSTRTDSASAGRCSSTCSNGRSASLPKRVSICPDARSNGGGGMCEGLLPYVPKAWEVYVLIAIPMAPFILLAFFLGPMLLED